MNNMMRWLSIIGGILVALWLLGFFLRLFGPLIHLLLIVAVVVFIVRLATGRRVV
jgi:hypothetical protein